jgi:hypothetical protein
VSTSTYASPFLQSSGGQQNFPWQPGFYGQPGQSVVPGFDQPQYGFGQLPFGQGGQGQQPFGGQFTGQPGLGVEQILPAIQVIVQMLGQAHQAIATAQHMAAQLPGHLAAVTSQSYQQLTPQRGFPQPQRPYSMAW